MLADKSKFTCYKFRFSNTLKRSLMAKLLTSKTRSQWWYSNVVVSVYLFPSVLFPMISVKLMAAYSVTRCFRVMTEASTSIFRFLALLTLVNCFKIVCSPLNISTRSSFSRWTLSIDTVETWWLVWCLLKEQHRNWPQQDSTTGM